MIIITQKSDFDELYDLYIGSKYIQIINHKPVTPIIKNLIAVHENLKGRNYMTLSFLLEFNINYYYLIKLCKNLESFLSAPKIYFFRLLNFG